MKLSERFDRRYQQAPLAAPVVSVEPPPSPNGPVTATPTAPVAAPKSVPVAAVEARPVVPAARVAELSTKLSPPLAAAKAEIHDQLLAHHTAQIDIDNPAAIRRLLLQLTEEHFRAKPPASLVTAADRERLVETLFDEVVGLGPLEALLRDPDVSEVMVNRPEQIFVERRGKIELTTLAFESEASLRRVIDRIVS
jgi:pilus assembly protein CpaF